jgi:hypothetical protein
MYRIDRRVWASVLFRTTTPDIIEGVIVKRSERLHWSRESAMEEAQGWADELTNPDLDENERWRRFIAAGAAAINSVGCYLNKVSLSFNVGVAKVEMAHSNDKGCKPSG